jgi:hypothetical protein
MSICIKLAPFLCHLSRAASTQLKSSVDIYRLYLGQKFPKIVGQKFPNDEKISEYFMVYEATKVFAIRKMKTQFTNKITHILRTDILHKHAMP